MSEKTNIEWATSTGNPWLGCTKVSPGCKNCYAAELDANRFSKTMGAGTKEKPESHWGKGAPRVRTKAFWKDAVKWNREAEDANRNHADQYDNETMAYDGAAFYPLPRPRIFPSLCDIWDTEVPIELLADYLQLVFSTPNLDHLILTKRPEHCLGRLFQARDKCFYGARPWVQAWLDGNPPSNVWIGTSVEDQKRADERIPLLLKIPAKVRFLSVEPLLEKVNIMKPLLESKFDYCKGVDIAGVRDRVNSLPWIHWVIGGGESGKDRRDPGVEPLIFLAKQCVEAGIPFFCKQDSAFKPGQQGRIPNDIFALKQFPTPAATVAIRTR